MENRNHVVKSRGWLESGITLVTDVTTSNLIKLKVKQSLSQLFGSIFKFSYIFQMKENAIKVKPWNIINWFLILDKYAKLYPFESYLTYLVTSTRYQICNGEIYKSQGEQLQQR